jgi:hypothetical protein
MPSSSSDPPITPAAAVAAVLRNEPPGAMDPCCQGRDGPLLPGRGGCGWSLCLTRGYRAATRGGPWTEKGLAHTVKKPSRSGGGLHAELPFEIADAGIFVLHQARSGPAHRPHLAPAGAVHDAPFGFGIAGRVLECGEAIEEFGDEFAFLRGHDHPCRHHA